MSNICIWCNGLVPWELQCPECRTLTSDCGKVSDLFGPYSPYRPIEDLQLTDAFNQSENGNCVHLVYCYSCSKTFYSSDWVLQRANSIEL